MSKKILENYKPKTEYFIKINEKINIKESLKQIKYQSQKKIINSYNNLKEIKKKKTAVKWGE